MGVICATNFEQVRFSAFSESILSQIAVILLPFVKSHPEFVVPLFTYLVVEKRTSLNDHFQELFFIPQVPCLAAVNEVLAKYNKSSGDVSDSFQHHLMEQMMFVDVMDTNSKVSLTHTLATDDRRLRVPQMEVRQYALRRLKMLLRKNQVPRLEKSLESNLKKSHF